MLKIDQVIRTKRKTFALIVRRDGSLLVRAPLRATDSQIEALVVKKESWIKSKQTLVSDFYAKPPPKEYVNGEGFLFLGRSNRLAIVDDQSEPLILSDQFYLACSEQPNAQAVFKTWYKNQAFQVISRRVEWFASKHGFVYKQVKITDAQTRWGSCGPKGSLNFSWRLVMSPMRVIDFVVIHELVHLQTKSHSKVFWGTVKTLMPDYQLQIAWLDRNGHLLTLG